MTYIDSIIEEHSTELAEEGSTSVSIEAQTK